MTCSYFIGILADDLPKLDSPTLLSIRLTKFSFDEGTFSFCGVHVTL